MIKLSKKVEYGLISVLFIDSNDGSEPVTCRQISDKYSLPYELTGKVLQSLKKAEIVSSVQGVKGGYSLNRALDDVSIGELIESIDGPFMLAPCVGSSEDCQCERETMCNIKTPVHHLQNLLYNFTYNISLAQFQNIDLDPDKIGAYNVYFERN